MDPPDQIRTREVEPFGDPRIILTYSMYDETASTMQGRLRLLESEVRHAALTQIEELVPRGTSLILRGIPRPVTLRNLEWVTAAYLDLRITDVHWVEDDPTGSIEDLMVGGIVTRSSGRHAEELRGRVTLGLAERSTFTASQLCEVLELVEWMQPLRRIETLLPRRTRAEIRPTILYRGGAPFIEATSVAWHHRSSTRSYRGLHVVCARTGKTRWQLADSLYFDSWALTAVADALEAARS